MIRTFIKKLIVFLIIIVIILWSVNEVYFKFILPRKNNYETICQYEHYKDTVHILIFGASIPRAAIKSDMIDNSFNFAVSGETYEQSYFKLIKAIQKDELDLKLIILPIDIYDLSREQAYLVWYWANDLDVSIKELSEKTHKNYLRLWLEKSFPVLGAGPDFFRNESSEMIKGWKKIKKEVVKSDLPYSAEHYVKQHFGNGYYNNNFDKNLNYFNKILELTSKNNITVILIKYPLTKEYLNVVEEQNISVRYHYEIINNSILKYDNVHILDYQNIFTNTSLFSDAVHLNRYGSEILTNKLIKDLEEKGIF